MVSSGIRRVAAWALFLTSAGWLVALVAAPHVVAHAAADDPRWVPVLATYALGAVVCHQRRDRSFELDGVPMPVCARCTGLYGGAAIGAAVGLLTEVWLGAAWRRRPFVERLSGIRWLILSVAAPTAISVVAEMALNLTLSNTVRAIVALPLGGVMAWFVVVAIEEST